MTASRTSRLSRAAGVVAAVSLLAGCGGTTGTVDAASGAPAPSAATSTAAGGAAAPASSTAAGESAAVGTGAPADTSADVAEAVDPAGLTVTAVRVARQEDHDRVVFELSGSGTPGWQVEYVDTPAAQGSGDAVDVPGSAALQVTLQGVSYPYETGATEVAHGPVTASGTEQVTGVVYDGTFEGTSVAWIGTDVTAPFRVYSLTGPSRVVVEVVDAG